MSYNLLIFKKGVIKLADFDWHDWQEEKKKINSFGKMYMEGNNSKAPANKNTELDDSERLLILSD